MLSASTTNPCSGWLPMLTTDILFQPLLGHGNHVEGSRVLIEHIQLPPPWSYLLLDPELDHLDLGGRVDPEAPQEEDRLHGSCGP